MATAGFVPSERLLRLSPARNSQPAGFQPIRTEWKTRGVQQGEDGQGQPMRGAGASLSPWAGASPSAARNQARSVTGTQKQVGRRATFSARGSVPGHRWRARPRFGDTGTEGPVFSF